MTPDTTLTQPSRTAWGTTILKFLLIMTPLSTAFYLTEHRLTTSLLDDFGGNIEDIEEATEGGQLKNQIGFSLVALVGLIGWVLPGRHRFECKGALPGLLALGFLLVCSSVMWSLEPQQTIKRLGILVFLLLGGTGVVRHFDGLGVAAMGLTTGLLIVTLGVAVELTLQTFTPTGPEYRFAGTLHPNAQANTCANLVLAATALLLARRGNQTLLGMALVVGVAFLLLTKSRSACAGLLFALPALYLVGKPTARSPLPVPWPAVGLGVGWCLSGLLYLLITTEMVPGDRALDTLFLGRGEDVGTLTGRTFLWAELLDYASERPILGYGFGGFWTVGTIEDVSKSQFWGINSAHSIFLATVLDLGLVGLVVFLGLLLTALVRAARVAHARNDPGFAFYFAILVNGLVVGVVETSMLQPALSSFFALCGMLSLAFFSPHPTPVLHPEFSPTSVGGGLCALT